MICVPELQQGIDVYMRLGFRVYSGGVHHGQGTHNAIGFFQDDYLELLSVRGGEHQHASAGLIEFLARGGGLRYVVVQSDDLAADVAAMRGRGVDVSDAIEGGRRTPAGQELRWNGAQLGPTGLTVAQPAEAGPAADALARRGPGPFQVLYRTGSMDAAATWMADHGVPPPARGIRNTGEQAMLVGPEHACGAYIGFVGPA